MMDGEAMSDDRNKSRNVRTALILASIALVFFLGVIVNRLLFGG